MPDSNWWRHAVFYEIYPRSFQDSNGDGIGDLPGITRRLDYIRDLGVDAIWITPFYPSPQVDFGYDVSDYEGVDCDYGAVADFERLVEEAHRRDIRVVIDLVLNHTSDQHPYFVSSRSARRSPHRDWYIWRDGRDGGPPNNWASLFGPTAWTLDEHTGQYYYHAFYPEQPDLNWRNPEVEDAIFASIRVWLERGVDGFRLDAINHMFEDPEMRDNPVLDELRPESDTERAQQFLYTRDLPDTHDVLRRLRTLCDGINPECVLIGEVCDPPSFQHLIEYYGDGCELHLPFNFFFTKLQVLSAMHCRAEVARAETALAGRATTWVLSHHDLPRAFSRYGDGRHDDQIAKLLITLLLTLRGAPFLYYGEELGMANSDPERVEDVRDPVGRRYWPTYKGRDGERTPMQWTSGAHAGFTDGTPWLPVSPAAQQRNVTSELADSSSILSYARRLLALRRGERQLRTGTYETIGSDAAVFAYRRGTGPDSWLVLLNVSDAPVDFALDEDGAVERDLVFSSEGREMGPLQAPAITLAAYEAALLTTR